MSTKPHPRKSHRGLKIAGLLIATLVILVALFIALIPQIARWTIVHNLEQQGYQASVSQIDVDLLNGRFTGKDIKANKADQTLVMKSLVLVFDWQALRQKQLSLLNLQLKGLRVDVTNNEQQKVVASETAAPQGTIDNTQADWWLGLAQISLQDSRICWHKAKSKPCLNIDNIQWQGNARLDVGQWNENLLKLPLSMTANLSVSGVDYSATKQSSLMSLEKLDIDNLGINTLNDIQASSLSLTRLVLPDSIAGEPQEQNPEFIRIESLIVKGVSLNKLARFAADKLSVSDVGYGETKNGSLFSLQKLDINKFKANTLDDIHADTLSLSRLVLPRLDVDQSHKESHDFVRFKSLVASQVDLKKLERLAVDKLSVNGLGIYLVRQQDGQWEVVRHLQQQLPAPKKLLPTQETKIQSQASKDLPLSLKVGRLVVENSQPITFVDRTLDTPFTIFSKKLTATATELDSNKPQQKSSFELDTQVDQHGRLKIKGELKPFYDELFLDVSGDMNAIDLRASTAYLERYLGHRVLSGQLNGTLELTVTEGMLDGIAEVELQHFNLEVANEEKASVLTQQLGTPLMASLTLLREEDKSIHLKIPVSGNINDPQFNTDDAVRKVVARAINEAVKNYYVDYGLAMAGVGQYSLAVKGVSKLYEFLTRLRFEPVKFDLGQSELSQEHKMYLDNLAEMLRQRPEVHLTLCGFATQSERPDPDDASVPLSEAQMKTMLQRANQRADAVKSYLINQQSITAKRLVVCEGQFEPQADRIPRVEISI